MHSEKPYIGSMRTIINLTNLGNFNNNNNILHTSVG